MKKIISVISVLLISGGLSAQAWKGKGDQKVSAGISAWGYGQGITATYDYGLTNLISVGAGLNFYFDGYRNNDIGNNVFAFGRINFHLKEALQLPEKWDIYPGVDVGVLGRDFGLGAHIGAKYFFTENWGAFAEVGNNGSFGVLYSF